MRPWRNWIWLLLPALAACGRDRHIGKGHEFLELGDLERAVQQFSQAINAAPRDARAHHGLALAYCRSDSAGPALRQYRILCKLSPDLADDRFLRQKTAGYLGLEPYPSSRLTSARGNDAFPAISADGAMIAFSSKRDGNTEIYLMEADGGGQRRLTDNRGVDYAPSFSPDGRTLAFVSDRDGNDEIYLLDLGTSAQRRLTHHPGEDGLPAFSPDGGRVLFISDREDKYRIYSADVLGAGSGRERGLHRVFDDDLNKIHFSVRRDRLLVQEERENQVALFTAPAEGGPKQALACPPFRAGLPTVLSPDGEHLLFTSSREGNDELYLLRVRDGAFVRLTASPSQEFGFGFSPDGKRLLYDSNRGGDRDIYLMHLDRLMTREEILAAIERE
jgi:TolB protein